jgi:asparagine synthase (glutamine-hydrolysing)
MTDALEHRGPDDVGIWCEGQIGLGHRRLAIRDLSAAGHQPQCDLGGRIFVSYNGEIYNDRALRADLERGFGFTFRSNCDTEIIPVGYLAWGEEIFERLEGMFAIALWDRAEQKLVLARDGIGIKPLFYSADENVVRFGSEIKALLADPDQSRRLSAEGVHRFLARGYCGPTSTTLEGIRQVPPGTVMTFTSRKEISRRFWQPKRQPYIRSVDDAVDGFLALWPQVVRDQLVSDVPVGILQSGGIDSTPSPWPLQGASPKSSAAWSISTTDRWRTRRRCRSFCCPRQCVSTLRWRCRATAVTSFLQAIRLTWRRVPLLCSVISCRGLSGKRLAG